MDYSKSRTFFRVREGDEDTDTGLGGGCATRGTWLTKTTDDLKIKGVVLFSWRRIYTINATIHMALKKTMKRFNRHP